MRRLLPLASAPNEAMDLAVEYAYPETGRWLRANFVVAIDGAISGPDGLSGSISGPADKRVFGALRRLADCVLVGAGTVRAEQYRPAKQPLAIVSGRLDLDFSLPLFTESTHRLIVLTTDSAPNDLRRSAEEVADVAVCGLDRVNPLEALEALENRGYRRLLCEGGPALLAQFVEAGLLDELCLTVSSLLAGAGPQLLPSGLDQLVPMRLAGLLEDDGFLFHRYVTSH